MPTLRSRPSRLLRASGREPSAAYFFRLSSRITAFPPSGSSEIQTR